VQRLTLKLQAAAIATPEDFVAAAQVDALFNQPSRLLPYFAYALPGGIVNVISFAPAAQVDHARLIFEVPLHAAQVGHLDHVAVRIVFVLR
jgi:hypothetical protein